MRSERTCPKIVISGFVNPCCFASRWIPATIAAAVVLPLILGTGIAHASTQTWNDAGNDWFAASNWTPAQIPGPGDHAVINAGTVLLTNSTAALASFSITGGTLTFSNWTTRLSATNVTLSGGSVTLPPPFDNSQMSNRVWIACSNMFIGSSGQINVDAKGYARGEAIGNGPGGGKDMGPANHYDCGGGGHGGRGGRWYRSGTNGLSYGSVTNPESPGSGGCNTASGRDGGGAVRIDATGTVTVNGTIDADGGSAGAYGSGGSGGSVWITCDIFGGTNGLITAAGGNANVVNSSGGGGGGRIAVIYDPPAQSNAPTIDVTFSTRGGRGTTWYRESGYGELGSLYFPDAQPLQETILHSGRWISPGFVSWAPDNLTVNGGWFCFPGNFTLNVTNDITVLGTYGLLELTNSTVSCGGTMLISQGLMSFNCESTTGMSLSCGNLIVTNGGDLAIHAGSTNASTPAYGAIVTVTGDILIRTNSNIYPWSHETNGGSVFFQINNMTIDVGGAFSADNKGFKGGNISDGYGPGRGKYVGLNNNGAGGYGGRGGRYSAPYGLTYGSSNAPVDAGSGGAGPSSSYPGGAGGGAAWISASGTITLNGTIGANGQPTQGAYGSSGSGGGIYIMTRVITGTNGTISATGGNTGGSNGRSGGGGGRIAIWSSYDQYQGACTLEAQGGTGVYTGEVGTIIWGKLTPTITTEPAVDVTNTAASLVGNLVATGLADTVVYVYWGQTNGFETKGDWATNDYLGTNDISFLTNNLTGLLPATVYYYQFYASNFYGDVWSGGSRSFSTLGAPSINNRNGATNITPTSAVLCGQVTGGNPIPSTSIFWGPTDGTNVISSWNNEVALGIASNPVLSAYVGELIANKTYYYRCYASNSYGVGWATLSTNFATLGPYITIDDVEVLEGADATSTDAVFTISLSATSLVDITIDFASSNGTASAGDFDTTNGSITITAGSVSTTIVVVVNGDNTDEYPSETFFVNLSSPSNGTFSDAQGRCIITDDDDVNQTKTWTGVANWTSVTNWSPPGFPGPADDVVIASGTATLSNSMVIASLTMNGGTLIFTNWSTKLTATTVSLNGGTVTLPPAFRDTDMSNRVWFVCTNMFVGSAAQIDVDSKGYARGNLMGYGPGGGYNIGTIDHYDCGGGGYAGLGGRWFRTGTNGLTYGSVSNPTGPGSGGCNIASGRDGGGSVRIEATETVTVNGTISAKGGSAGAYGSGGSGGAVWITCNIFAGTNGLISADGGNANVINTSGGGGGGRVAVIYNPVAQAAAPLISVKFSTRAGKGTTYKGYSGYGGLGTLYFPDSQLIYPVIPHEGRLVVPGFTSWAPPSLTASNGWFSFPGGFTLSVIGDLNVIGSAGQLELTNSTVTCGGDLLIDQAKMVFNCESTTGLSLYCGGDLILTNGGRLYVYAGITNAANPDYGALVRVTGDAFIRTNSSIYPFSHGTNGGSPLIRALNMTIDPGGSINADGRGYNGGRSTHGAGTGRGKYISQSNTGGGGYGGRGGKYSAPYGLTYGSSNAPVHPGSGGAGSSGYPGGNGGGLVRLEISQVLSLSGIITADGSPSGGYGAGGAGGGIYLTVKKFAGSNGTLSAAGGNGSFNGGGAGGGGRIAVWTTYNIHEGTCTTDVSNGTSPSGDGEIGTVVWGYIPAPGTIFILR